MQRILWIGGPFFGAELRSSGWQDVVLHNFEDDRIFGWDDLVRLAGFTPDVLVVADKSRPPFVLGVENFPCLTVFYSVDSHIHSWQPFYAQAFDACIVSLRDHLSLFSGPFLEKERLWWSPPFAWEHDQPDPEAQARWDCIFVGNITENTPLRSKFLGALGDQLPGLHVTRGNYRRLFPQGRVLLNHCEHGDLNFRVFEALGCGGCLVTPRVGHGMAELFVDGEHLVGYAPNDVGDALYRIKFLLEHPEVAAHIGAAGLAEVNARHRAGHRAQAFTDHLCDLWTSGYEDIVPQRLARSGAVLEQCLRLLYLHWAEECGNPDIRRAYLAAAKGRYGLAGPEA
ncbi:MAG: glycosyltransferase [Desulfovibrio sp.]|nr:glycosyltransferase [Desulfovibrio sp.]